MAYRYRIISKAGQVNDLLEIPIAFASEPASSPDLT